MWYEVIEGKYVVGGHTYGRGDHLFSDKPLDQIHRNKFRVLSDPPPMVDVCALPSASARQHPVSLPPIPVNVVVVVWGEWGGKWLLDYVVRLYVGVSRWLESPFTFHVMADTRLYRDLLPKLPAGIHLWRIENSPTWVGCLPKLNAMNPANGFKGRVIVMDVDTVPVGPLDKLFTDDGPFTTRMDEFERPVVSGGGLLSFRPDQVVEAWELFANHTDKVIEETRIGSGRFVQGGSERMFYRRFFKPGRYWQEAFPGAMVNYKRQFLKGTMGLKEAALVVFNGKPHPHELTPIDPVRRRWESYGLRRKYRVDVTNPRNEVWFWPIKQIHSKLVLEGLGHDVDESGIRVTDDVDGAEDKLLFERNDGAQLSGAVRNNVERTNIKLVLKTKRFRDPAHTASADEKDCVYGFGKPFPKSKHTTCPDKVRVCWGLGLERMQRFMSHEPDFERDRDVDVHFRGTTKYDGFTELEEHRLALVGKLGQLKGLKVIIAKDRTTHTDKYHRELMGSKVVVSPHGLGMTCYRDFEALLSGCVLVKPRTCSLVESVPDIYDPDANAFVPCEPDWSDLEEAVRSALVRFKDVELRRRLRRWVMDEWGPLAIGRRMHRIFSEAYET